MAKLCDCCGNSIGWGDVYSRPVRDGGESANLCSNCALKIDGLLNKTDPAKIASSLEWAKGILGSGRSNPSVRNVLCGRINVAEKTIAMIQSNVAAHAGNNSDASVNMGYNNNVVNNNNQNNFPMANIQNQNSFVETSSMWTGILKVMAVIAVIGMTIAGGAVGGLMADGIGIFFGIFLGLIVGFVSVSALMVFVEMAEDARATRQHVMRIRYMMEKDIDNK